MDTFQRYVGYDNATNKLTCEPSFTNVFPWMPQEGPGQLAAVRPPAAVHRQLDELRGYDLLDVFFPKYGDAFTAHIARLLTGTPYGPVDFVLRTRRRRNTSDFGVLAVLGQAAIVKMETRPSSPKRPAAARRWSSARSTSPLGKGTLSARPSA